MYSSVVLLEYRTVGNELRFHTVVVIIFSLGEFMNIFAGVGVLVDSHHPECLHACIMDCIV